MNRRASRVLLVLLSACVVLGVFAAPAAAEHLDIDVSAPDTAGLGQEVEIRTSVRSLETGAPEEGVVLVFYSDANFVGVTGEIEVARVVTDAAGVATLHLDFKVAGTHALRIEAVAGPEIQPESISIPVTVGGQLVRSEVGVRIPGLGGWIVTAVIAAVWVIMILAAWSMLAVARNAPERRAVSLAHVAVIVMALMSSGLVVILARSPETHANLNPKGYERTPVAYTEADYLYPGPGLTPGISPEQSVAYGRAIFMARGCAGCHGVNAQGAATAGSPAGASREWLESVVRSGLPGGMPAYSDIYLHEQELDAMYVFLLAARGPGGSPDGTTTTTTTTVPSTTAPPDTTTPTDTTTSETTVPGSTVGFADVAAIFQAHCAVCHGSQGGWDASTRDAVLNTGNNAPVVVPGDPDASLLVAKMRGTQTIGIQMPPSGLLSDADVQVIVDWIAAGAPD